jgi:hypothetical protein
MSNPINPLTRKRYALFSGEHYYPLGGFDDYGASFDSLEEAIQVAKALKGGCWWHIVDLNELVVVADHCHKKETP